MMQSNKCFFTPQGKKRWIHRFTEHFAPASLSCISAGQSLVALGSKDGQIHVYESSNEYKCLRLVTILTHHTGKGSMPLRFSYRVSAIYSNQKVHLQIWEIRTHIHITYVTSSQNYWLQLRLSLKSMGAKASIAPELSILKL